MTWFLFSLACIVLWGISDVLFKAATDYEDPLSHYKSFVWIGIIMAMAGGVMSAWSETLSGSIQVVKENLYLIPLTIVYALTLFFGLLGIKYLDISVVTLMENIDGAMAAIILVIYFLLTGTWDAANSLNALDIVATVVIVIGVIMLGFQEQKLHREAVEHGPDKKKPRLGAVALLFPMLYNLADAASLAAIGITVSGESGAYMPNNDFFIFECAGFALVSVFVWLYMLLVKKHFYNPFQESEMVRCGAATGETFGTMTFIFAAAQNPVLTPPITSAYCLVTVLLARLFLKERLSKKRYITLGLLAVGILLLSI